MFFCNMLNLNCSHQILLQPELIKFIKEASQKIFYEKIQEMYDFLCRSDLIFNKLKFIKKKLIRKSRSGQIRVTCILAGSVEI